MDSSEGPQSSAGEHTVNTEMPKHLGTSFRKAPSSLLRPNTETSVPQKSLQESMFLSSPSKFYLTIFLQTVCQADPTLPAVVCYRSRSSRSFLSGWVIYLPWKSRFHRNPFLPVPLSLRRAGKRGWGGKRVTSALPGSAAAESNDITGNSFSLMQVLFVGEREREIHGNF